MGCVLTKDLDKIRDDVASLNVSPIPKLNEKFEAESDSKLEEGKPLRVGENLATRMPHPHSSSLTHPNQLERPLANSHSPSPSPSPHPYPNQRSGPSPTATAQPQPQLPPSS